MPKAGRRNDPSALSDSRRHPPFDGPGSCEFRFAIIRLKQSDMSVATPGPPRTAASVVDLIGNTPLIRLSGFERGLRNVELYAKAEWKNPGGSVKDRPAVRMIADALFSIQAA